MPFKVSRSKELEKTAERLLWLVEERRKVEREERALKETFKHLLRETTSLQVGDYFVTAVPKTRAILDRASLVSAFGEASIRECEKECRYTEVSVVHGSSLVEQGSSAQAVS